MKKVQPDNGGKKENHTLTIMKQTVYAILIIQRKKTGSPTIKSLMVG